MYKLLFLFITFTTLAYSNDKVEIFATNMDTQDNIVNASGDVAVIYQDYYLSALRAVYNRTTGDLELFDNVRANKGGEYKLLGNYAKLNIINKKRTFQPFYMLDEDTKVWISADKGCLKDKDLDISSGMVSSCNPNNPLWQMEFTSSDYNMDTKWLNLYNTRFYIYDIPIFYTPWFGYSLDKTRRTGLLMPSFGYSGTEGVFYQQPIYIAEQNWWDLELKPQLRTSRGAGVYGTFRFTDSNSSKGELNLGYFKENKKYFEENNLANDSHHGFSFKYENNNFLNNWFNSSFDGQSGIYVDINNMNDIDYVNLASSNSIETATSTQTISRINMFYNTDSDYIGTYFKYYQELTSENDDNVIQVLPTLHYHHYLETLFDEHVIYSVDMKSNNLHREINKKVVQTDLNIPISVSTTLFDEYLDLSFKTNLYAQHSAFSGNEQTISTDEYKDGYVAKNDNVVSASTQLAKAYEDFSHVMGFGVNYKFDGTETETGFYRYNKDFCRNPLNSSDSRCEFYGISDVVEELEYDFSQYIYDTTGKQILYHRLSQSVTYADIRRLGDLENELDYMIMDSINIYNNLFYNHDRNKLSKIYTRLSYNDYGLNLSLSHLYKNTFLEPTLTYSPRTSYMTSAAKYTFNSRYSYHMAYDYDLELKTKKRAEIGFMYRKRCWDFGISYVENNRPQLDASGTIVNNYDKYIYFNLVIKPFMRQGNRPFFAYELKED